MGRYGQVSAKLGIGSRSQAGQAIVLMALALIALLGITGLALDGGGMFFLQRDAQNATDAAVVAATYAICATAPLPAVGAPDFDALRQRVVQAGERAAAENGFVNGQDGRTVTIEYPPASGEKAGDRHYVDVTISAIKPAYFIQVVYKGPLQVTVDTVGYCNVAFNPHLLQGIIGLSQTCDQTVQTNFSDSNISGGIYSNREVQMTGSNGGSTANATVTGGVQAHTTITTPSSGSVSIDYPVTGVDVIDDPLASVDYYQVGAYAPTGTIGQRFLLDPNLNTSVFYHYYTPGGSNASDASRYQNGTWRPRNTTLKGLYYVEGDVYLGNNNITFDQTLGISIVATGTISNHLNPQGNPQNAVQGTVHYYTDSRANGILFFSNYATLNCGNGNAAIDIRTGNFAYWRGLLYAPHGAIKVSGANNGSDTLSISGVIIGQTIQLSGSTLVYTADTDVLTAQPPQVIIAS